MKKILLAALTVILFLTVSSLSAQEASARTRPMREEIVKLNYVTTNDVSTILMPLVSREGRVNWSPNQSILTIKDYPENVEKVLSVIKKIDVKPADLVFTVKLILASAADDIKTDESLAADPLLKELRSFLRYKNYAILDTSLVRAIDKQRSRITLGTKETEFFLELEPVYVSEGKTELLRVNVDLAQRWESIKADGGVERQSRSLIESTLSIKSGESTVVGVSKMGGSDKGLILIISGKVIK